MRAIDNLKKNNEVCQNRKRLVCASLKSLFVSVEESKNPLSTTKACRNNSAILICAFEVSFGSVKYQRLIRSDFTGTFLMLQWRKTGFQRPTHPRNKVTKLHRNIRQSLKRVIHSMVCTYQIFINGIGN